MRRSRTIRTRCGTVVVELGRVQARRRSAAARKPRPIDCAPRPIRTGLAAELARMLRDRLAFPEMLFARDR